jgi:AbrB family looped-hinge helix DNA binding protein
METVTVSPKFQIVIPRNARKVLEIRTGQKVQIIVYKGRLELLPVRPVRKMRGFAKGMDTAVQRENDHA